MGISGLLPFLKKASRPCHIREFSGTTAAVDVYCFLHKGAFGCAEKLVQGQFTDGYILYVMKYVDLLLHHDIKPVLVFDGKNLPSKAVTEKKRRENRTKYRQMAKDFLRDGRAREARECFQRCIDITPEMARAVIKACQERNIDYVIAPYEADAQLAFLNQNGLADLVISEDSDLTLFGCDKIMFKLDSNGSGVLYEKEKLNLCLGTKADSFNFEKFRYMGIMAGCDYLPSLHGIGLGKSFKFWSRVSNPNLRQVLPKIPSYLNMYQLKVTDDYIEGFIRADNTFLYQIVFDIKERKTRPLNDYPESRDLGTMSYAGTQLEDEVALELALGNVDIHTMDVVSDFHPDRVRIEPRPKYGKRANHSSIWEKGYTKREVVQKESDLETSTAFGYWQKKDKKPLTEKRKRSAESLEMPEDEDNAEDLTSVYNISENATKRLKADGDEIEISTVKKIYISKYFAKYSNADQEPKDTKKEALEVPTRKKETNWLEQLDTATESVENKFIYRTDLLLKAEESCKPENEVTEATAATKLPMTEIDTLDRDYLRSSEASMKAFKPVVVAKKSPNAGEDLETKRKRNPFMMKTPQKENVQNDAEDLETKQKRNPFLKKSPEPLKENNNTQDSSQDASSEHSSSGIMKPPSSQSSLMSSQASCLGGSIDNDSFSFSPISISDSQDAASSTQEESSTETGLVVSSYFQKKSSKPKGLSGLVKGRKSSNGQRNLLEMWSKKS